MDRPINILFAGSPECAAQVLGLLLKDDSGAFRVVGVLTNPPSAQGRGRETEPTPVAVTAREAWIPVLTPERLDSKARQDAAALSPDALVCFSYGKIFGPKFLGLFPLGGINLHPSLLPKYRGSSPVQEAILNRDEKTGVTVQEIALAMDCGNVLASREVTLDGSETSQSLLETLSVIGASLLIDVLTFARRNDAFPEGTPQNEDNATYCAKREKEDGRIDWTFSAPRIEAKIRAFHPWPGCFTYAGNALLKIHRAALVPPESAAIPEGAEAKMPGTVLGIDENRGILVQTGSGVLALQSLQRPTKKTLLWRDFINGDREFLNAVLGGGPEEKASAQAETDSAQKSREAGEGKRHAKQPRKRPLGSIVGLYFQKLDSNAGVFTLTALIFVLVTAFAAGAVFFSIMRGPEQVLVPDVTGKELAGALVEMQEKELFPKIQMRYSNNPGDKGLILEQDPEAGVVVKAGRRVNLTVSRGVIIEAVEDYVGQNIDDLRIKLQTLFSGSARPLIALAQPLYKADAAPAGTILEQDPLPGAEIVDPVTVRLVVSRGPEFESVRAPNLVGMSVNDALQQLARTKLIFDFTSRPAQGNETPGVVVSQDPGDSRLVPTNSRVKATFAFGPSRGDTVTGLFAAELPEYPYPVPMRLDVKTPEGNSFTLISFNHPGGNFTVPYSVPTGSELYLYVAGREEAVKTAGN